MPIHDVFGSIVRFIRCLSVLFISLFSVSLHAAVTGAITDGEGNRKYWILLDEGVAAEEPSGIEAPARRPRDLSNLADPFGWHKPNVRALVRRLEGMYKFKAVGMTSHAAPSFAAFLSPDTLEAISAHPAVREVVLLRNDDVRLSAWADQYSGSEIIPWGKIAIGTNDSLSTSNPVYVIDGGVQPHDDLNLSVAPIFSQCASFSPGHATHVAGIVGARMSTGRVRGVNPGAPVISVPMCDPADPRNETFDQSIIGAAMDWVLADTNDLGIYAVANISANGIPFGEGYPLTRYFRRLSNRVLVVHSAGNFYNNACFFAYGPANDYDGILVVGGIDENGQAVVQPSGGYGYVNPGSSEPGSNWGNCVEVWAPSQRVWSTWSSSSTGTMQLSGTSMAAPYISGLAARYGGSSTTPVERERYIRSKAVATGFTDLAGIAIKVPSYPQPPSETIPTKLSISSVYADSSSSTAYLAVDGNHATSWSAGHAAPAWIEFDLGSVKTVKAIRLTPEMSPATGTVVQNVYAGMTAFPTTLVKTFSGTATILEPIALAVNSSVRYVRIETASSPSWIAWREIEILGY